MNVLVIDNYDSFVYNIIQYLKMLGANVDIVSNADLDSLKEPSKYNSVVISPGPGNPEIQGDRGETVEFLENSQPRKVLGICFGHQLLGFYLGSRIKLAGNVHHGYVDTIRHTGGKLYRNVPAEFKAIRYHSLVIEEEPSIVVDAVSSSDGSIMGFHSEDGRMHGIQFHPESYYSEHGLAMLENFLGI